MLAKAFRPLRAVFLGAVLFVGAAPVGEAQTRRVPCAEVLGRIDRVVSRGGPAAADPIKLGKTMKVDPLWIERCAQVYGRRLSRPPRRAGLSKEEQDEVWESEEPEEFAREEFETRDEVYFHEIPDDRRDRARLRRFKPDTTTSNEWQPFVTHEWNPDTGAEWRPFLLDK
jgi:hypothetical protein